MALDPHIQSIFGDSPTPALTWAKAIITSQFAAMQTEEKLAVAHGGSGEFAAMAWSIHASTLEAVHALIEVAEHIAEVNR